jgi:GH43 family beta-xylosidase
VYDWYTVEGAAVLHRDGRWYCFYSGGRWENESYGITYVVADHPLGPYRYPPDAKPLIATVPGYVLGPGHHSFTTAPNGEQVYVYHAWDTAMRARLMRIDRFGWVGDQPFLHTPTWTPQPAFDGTP